MKWITLGVLFLFAWIAAAAQIDGTWSGEMKSAARKKGGGQETVSPITLNLKAEGNQLTGTVSISRGKKRKGSRPIQIQDGKIDGNSFSFTTVQSGKKGEKRQTWQGTIEGDQLKGSTGRGKRGTPFTAKRTNG
jgi:hypothetical protein